MRQVKKYIAGLTGLLLAGAGLVSCTKTFDQKNTETTNFSNSTVVQFFVATVNASRNYIYVNGVPANGSSLTTGTLFPASGIGFAVVSGMKSFLVRDTLSTSTQAQLSFANNMQLGKRYTIFMYDTITSPKQKTVETSIVVPQDTTSRLRFANFVYNPGVSTPVDVFSFNRNTNIFTNVSVTDVTNFIPYPSNLSPDTLYIRPTGTTTDLLKVSISRLTAKRSYTVVYRGSDRGTAKFASLFANN